MHTQSLGLSIVHQCRHIQHISFITIQCSSDCVLTYIVYTTRLHIIPHMNNKKEFTYKLMKDLAYKSMKVFAVVVKLRQINNFLPHQIIYFVFFLRGYAPINCRKWVWHHLWYQQKATYCHLCDEKRNKYKRRSKSWKIMIFKH